MREAFRRQHMFAHASVAVHVPQKRRHHMMRRMQRDATMRRMLTTAKDSPMELDHLNSPQIRAQKQSRKHVRLEDSNRGSDTSSEEGEYDEDSRRGRDRAASHPLTSKVAPAPMEGAAEDGS